MDASNLDVIAPPAKAVRFRGRDLELKPLTVAQLPGVLRALDGVDLSNGLDQNQILPLLTRHGEQLTEAVRIAARLEADDLAAADLAEFIDLAGAVIEVNADFFAQRLAPALTGVIQRLVGRLGAGQTPFRR